MPCAFVTLVNPKKGEWILRDHFNTMVLKFAGNSEIGAQKGVSLLFDLYKVFDFIESSHGSILFNPKRLILLHAWATGNKLPSYTNTMIYTCDSLKLIVEFIKYFFLHAFKFIL